MSQAFEFSVSTIRFDEHYQPSENTRITTNFANLARGKRREANLRDTLRMINNRFNALANWDNPTGDRYSVELDIVSVDIDVTGNGQTFPTIEILKTEIVDQRTNERIPGLVGNNFSSYLRDYDFSVLLQEHNKDKQGFSIPNNFGALHGKIFQSFVQS
ncbi:MAG: putative oxygenase MesX, partial [Pseudomonadota bacterium]|nr:putative oxygenase MesX [Pseudomonadota bacterium]